MLATAFFDGTVGIHSIQSTNELPGGSKDTAPRSDGADIFDAPGFSSSSQSGTLSLKQPPKWLRRPTACSFSFGGKLVTVSNLASSQGKPQSSVVHIRKVVTETELVDRAKQLQVAIDGDSLQTFAEERTDREGEGWKALLSLFKADSRDELVTLLGFSKAEIASRVAEAVENLKTSAEVKSSFEDQDTVYKPHESVVSFAEPEREELQSYSEDDGSAPAAVSEEKTPSEVSASVTSDTASAVLPTDGESATTAPSLFGDDILGTPQVHAGHDFFNTVGVAQDDGESHPVHVPHTNYGLDSSVAATIGSGPSSVTSESTKTNGFRIYPGEESDVDRLVTKALVLGDFDSAVALCLSSDRFADAILLAVRGSPELLQRTQKAYFERRTSSLPSLRLFQSIIINDLSDIVQNADLQEWREIFVVLCTFASQDEFSTLAEQLGRRLEYEFTLAQGSDDQEAEFYRKNATLTYLAAARLERLVSIWADELVEEEKARVSNKKYQNNSSYSAHAHALQTFVEKVTVFRAATNYKDEALVQSSTNGNEPPQTFKLAALYDRYFEYADLLCTQGLMKDAVGFLRLTPVGYKGSALGSDFSSERKRLIDATTTSPTPGSAPRAVKTSSTTPAATVPAVVTATATATVRPTSYGYTGYSAPTQHALPQQHQQPTTYSPYEAPSMGTVNPYGQQVQQSQQQPHHSQTNASTYAGQHNTPNSFTQPPHLRQHQQPPAPAHLSPRAASGPPPPPKRDGGGWNDAPTTLPPPSRVPAALPLNKPPAITSPFPNAAPSPGSPYLGQGSATLPPPPRPGSVTRGQAPTQGPPPGHRLPPQASSGAFPVRPPSQAAGHGPMATVPSRIQSPPQGQVSLPQREPTPSQYAPPPSRLGQTMPPGPGPFQHPPSGQPYVQAAPPQTPSYGSGPVAPFGASQQQPGPYGPPQGMQQQQQRSGPSLPPPPPGGAPRAVSRSAATPPVRAPPPPPKYRKL
jgi:protein transport protein SEC31